MDRPEENPDLDRKIGSFLRRDSSEVPSAPANEYHRILKRIEGRSGYFAKLSWMWRLAFPLAALVLALFLYLPRPSVSPDLSSSAESYGGYGIFIPSEKAANETPGEDWILLAEIVSRP